MAWLQESSTCMSDTNPLPVPCDMAASHVRLLLAQTPTLPLRPLIEFSSFILAGAVEPSTTSEYRMPLSPAIPQHATPLSITPLHKGDGDGHIVLHTSQVTRAHLQHFDATAAVAAARPILFALQGTCSSMLSCLGVMSRLGKHFARENDTASQNLFFKWGGRASMTR